MKHLIGIATLFLSLNMEGAEPAITATDVETLGAQLMSLRQASDRIRLSLLLLEKKVGEIFAYKDKPMIPKEISEPYEEAKKNLGEFDKHYEQLKHWVSELSQKQRQPPEKILTTANDYLKFANAKIECAQTAYKKLYSALFKAEGPPKANTLLAKL